MKIRYLFSILSALLIITGISLLVLATSINSIAIYIAEAFIVLCIIFIIYFHTKIIKTLNALANGMELLNEQDFSSRLSFVGQHDADRVVDVFNRMMQQLKSEHLRLLEQDHFLDLIIKSSPMGVIILNWDNEISSINKAGLNFLGLTSESELIGHNISSIGTPLAERLNSIKQDETATVRIGDAQIYRCSRLSFVDRGFHHPFILIESLTDEVMIAEKKAYEKVIRMIAHEVNNSVAGVTSILSSISDTISNDDTSADLIEAMKICVERCFVLNRFITRFANVVKIPEPILLKEDLNKCVVHCKSFMESICNDRNIKLRLFLSNEPVLADIDSHLIEQVLVNIIKNSVESIEANGEITISTTTIPAQTITIADNGKGINTEAANKLFTPFFSTKTNGEGLGLIFIREVLMKHHCHFSLRTYEDQITRFTISF